MSAAPEPPPSPGITHGRAVEADSSIEWRRVWVGAPATATEAANGLLAQGIALRIASGRGWCGTPVGSDSELLVAAVDEQAARTYLDEHFPQRHGRGVGRVLLRILVPWRRF